jgi:hypothetical protein
MNRCQAYVAAVVDMMSTPGAARPACFPVGTRIDVLIPMVVEQMRAASARRYERASEVLADALHEKFPCG